MSEIRKVKSVEAVNFIDDTTSLLSITFDNDDVAYMFELYSNIAPFIGKDVIVAFRREMVNGKLENVVVTWAQRSVVTTLDKEKSIKLYADEMPDIGSNVLFMNLNEGDMKQNAIVYCDSVWKGSSAKATWVSFRVLDKKRNVAELKVFNPENTDIADYAKRYLICDIFKNKYGLSTQGVYIKDGISISANPEVALAKQYILEVLTEDEPLLNTVQELMLLEAMEIYCPVDYVAEAGSVLIQTAIELSLARDMRNLTKRLDITHLYRIIVMSKSYVFTHTIDSPLSKELQAIMKTTGCRNILSKRLLNALEANPQRKQIEREVYEGLVKLSVPMLQSIHTTGLVLSTDKIWK